MSTSFSRPTSRLRKFIATSSLFLLLNAVMGVVASQEAGAITQIDVTGTTLNFAVANRTNIVGTGGDSQGDIVKYSNVVTVNGVVVDAVVETVSLVNIQSSTIDNMDAGSNYGEGTCNTARASNVNCAENFGIDMTTTGSGGSAQFRFSFYEAGTYTRVNTGVPIVLRNVRVTSLDLDTSGGNEYQYTDFSGFQSHVLNSPTRLVVDSSAAPLVRFKQGTSGVTANNDARDQVQVFYSSISTFDAKLGNLDGGMAYFGLLFQPETFPNNSTVATSNNPGNVAPTAGNDSRYVPNGAPAILNADENAAVDGNVVSDFGDYQDGDGQGLSSIKIVSLPATGSLEFWNGTAWTAVTVNQSISAGALNSGFLRYTAASQNASFTFSVNDGVVDSASTYTLNLVVSQQQQSITVVPHGAPGSPVTPTITATSGNTPVVASQTTGVCTVNGSTITVVSGVTSGVCVIQITEPGDATYAEAPAVSLRINISGGNLLTIPQAVTDPATSVQSTSAQLEGTVNPNGLSTTVTFIYGTNPLLNSGVSTVTATQSPLTNGTSPVAVSASVSGLAPGTYFFRVIGTSTGGIYSGVIRSFSIAAPAATTTTVAPTTTVATTVPQSEARSLPSTGASSRGLWQFALVLILMGLVAVTESRIRYRSRQ